MQQTDNPDKRSYSYPDLMEVDYTSKNCGIIPLSEKFYWIYLDSIYENGAFSHTENDTLRFEKTYKTQNDGLIWWEANKFMGLPDKCYANDSCIFSLGIRMFSSVPILDAKKEFYLFPQDSIRYMTSFGDEAAMGKAIKLSSTVSTSYGNYSDCILFEKYARSYRRDRVTIKPGIGVIKFTHEEAPLGNFTIQLQRISTLIRYHIE